MLLKCTATCLLAVALFSSYCDAQWKPSNPKPEPPGKQYPINPQQSKQTFEKPLEWKYPEDPQPESPAQPTTPFEVRHPVPVSTVAVDCGESYVHVEVKKDMFGIGQFIYPGGLTLGNCPVSAEDNTGQVLIFQYELQSCGSELIMTDYSFIYSYVLNYDPPKYGDSPVVRTSKAAVIVECHYPRRQNVSSLALLPLWVPFSAVKVAEGFLYFSLKLMTDDWMYERPSYQYFLGDVIHIEVSVMQFFHVPLRVYVDRCVATSVPDVNSLPRYAFIDNHGCFVDGRVTHAASFFLPRTAENKLRFQIDAFRFQGVESGVMYITCHLKATSTAHNIHELHRACSYTNNMWREVSGADAACGSCESGIDLPLPPPPPGKQQPMNGPAKQWLGTSQGGGSTSTGASGGGTTGSGTYPWTTVARHPSSRKARDVTTEEVFDWEGDVTVGPFVIDEKIINA